MHRGWRVGLALPPLVLCPVLVLRNVSLSDVVPRQAWHFYQCPRVLEEQLAKAAQRMRASPDGRDNAVVMRGARAIAQKSMGVLLIAGR